MQVKHFFWKNPKPTQTQQKNTMPNSSSRLASFAAKGFQKNHRAFQKDEFSKKSRRSKALTQPSEAKSSQQSNSFTFKRAGPVKAIPKTETKRKSKPRNC